MVVVDKGPRQKAPIKIDAPVRGGYGELLSNWKWFFFIPLFFIIFPMAQAARTFSDIWITRYTPTTHTHTHIHGFLKIE